jgi:hypothetical protein
MLIKTKMVKLHKRCGLQKLTYKWINIIPQIVYRLPSLRIPSWKSQLHHKYCICHEGHSLLNHVWKKQQSSFFPSKVIFTKCMYSVLPLGWNMMSIIYIRNTAKTSRNCSTSYEVLLTHQLKAFSKKRNHGDTVYLLCQLAGIHGHCHSCVQRSGCGIMARWRPSSEHIPATPPTEHGKIQ